MKKKPRVALLFGGKSAEHEVSIQSAKSVYKALKEKEYDVTLIGIDSQGTWFPLPQTYLIDAPDTLHKLTAPNQSAKHIGSHQALVPYVEQEMQSVDVVFPVLHGTYGEDGSVQGLLSLANVAFVGAGVVGSAVSMDKEITKKVLQSSGVPVAKYSAVRKSDTVSFAQVTKQLGLSMFIKPANLGSSVGVNKVTNQKEFDHAVADAFQYDTKIIIEECIDGDEVFCSIIGNENPRVSSVGRLIHDHEFYDYDAKYIDDIEMEIPAKLPASVTKHIQEISLKACKALCCDGMARADLFVTKKGDVYFGELNTIPGFTSHSWYPKLWEASGLSYPDLVEELLTLALEKHTDQQALKTSR